MPELASRSRTTLRLPRVEFDLSGLLLGMAGYFAYQQSWEVLASLFGIGGRITEKVQGLSPGGALKLEAFNALNGAVQVPGMPWLLQQIGWAPLQARTEKGVQLLTDLPSLTVAWWEFALVAVWFLLLWSVIGGALSRVHARRIARDESEGVFDALAFSVGSLPSLVGAPLFGLAAIVFFGALNVLAGLALSIPWAGPVLQLVVHPLALLGGAVLTIFVIGAAFGLPTLQAAVVTEKNGMLDAVSRTFSYIFSRPVLFLVGSGVVFAIAGLVLACGEWFLRITTETLLLGSGIVSGDAAGEPTARDAIAGGVQAGTALGWPSDVKLETPLWLTFHVSWLFGYLGRLLVQGVVLSYVVGGLTDVYFMLRGEVDGIDDTEIYVEGEALSLGDPVPEPPTAS